MKITSFFNETGFNTENHYVLQIDPEEVTRGCSVKKTEKFRKIIWKCFQWNHFLVNLFFLFRISWILWNISEQQFHVTPGNGSFSTCFYLFLQRDKSLCLKTLKIFFLVRTLVKLIDFKLFLANIPTLYPQKIPENLYQKTKGFLVLSGGIKWEHWPEKG